MASRSKGRIGFDVLRKPEAFEYDVSKGTRWPAYCSNGRLVPRTSRGRLFFPYLGSEGV
jgi:hypothetical protein